MDRRLRRNWRTPDRQAMSGLGSSALSSALSSVMSTSSPGLTSSYSPLSPLSPMRYSPSSSLPLFLRCSQAVSRPTSPPTSRRSYCQAATRWLRLSPSTTRCYCMPPIPAPGNPTGRWPEYLSYAHLLRHLDSVMSAADTADQSAACPPRQIGSRGASNVVSILAPRIAAKAVSRHHPAPAV